MDKWWLVLQSAFSSQQTRKVQKYIDAVHLHQFFCIIFVFCIWGLDGVFLNELKPAECSKYWGSSVFCSSYQSVKYTDLLSAHVDALKQQKYILSSSSFFFFFRAVRVNAVIAGCDYHIIIFWSRAAILSLWQTLSQAAVVVSCLLEERRQCTSDWLVFSFCYL